MVIQRFYGFLYVKYLAFLWPTLGYHRGLSLNQLMLILMIKTALRKELKDSEQTACLQRLTLKHSIDHV